MAFSSAICPLIEVESPEKDPPDRVQPKPWPLSGKPYWNFIIQKSHVQPPNMPVLPISISSVLPSIRIPSYITYGRNSWEVGYDGSKFKRFYSGWKAFAVDNNLKIGDACVLELIGDSSKELIFRAQILRGDLPSEFQNEH